MKKQPATAFVFIAKGRRNEQAESYPSNLNSASAWQAVSLLFWTGQILLEAFIWHQSLCNSWSEGTVLFQILWGILSHVKYNIYSYLNKLIVSQSSTWLTFVDHVLYESVLWFNFCASLRSSDFSPNKDCLLFVEMMEKNIQLLLN